MIKISKNIHSKENLDGYLLSSLESYGSCLCYDLDKFRRLVNDDVEKWNERLQQTKNDSAKISEEAINFLAQ